MPAPVSGGPWPDTGERVPKREGDQADAYLDVPLDLSGALWIATATDAGAIHAAVRDWLYVVGLPACTEQEKLAIVQEHLLRRPFDDLLPTSAGVLALEPAASAASVGVDPPVPGPAAQVVVADRVVSSIEELRALSAGAPAEGDDAGEPCRTAASRGDVRFEPEALRRVIRDYTSEPGVKDLEGAARRHLPSGHVAPAAVGPAAGHRHVVPRPGAPLRAAAVRRTP